MPGLVGNRKPPLQSVRFAAKMYGQIQGMSHHGKAMVWLLDDPTNTAVVVQNAPGTEDGVSRTTYDVEAVKVSSMGMTVGTTQGDLLVIQAPCTCGAGLTATALPMTALPGHKIDLQPAEVMPAWIRRA